MIITTLLSLIKELKGEGKMSAHYGMGQESIVSRLLRERNSISHIVKECFRVCSEKVCVVCTLYFNSHKVCFDIKLNIR